MNLRPRWHRFWNRPALSWGEAIAGLIFVQLLSLLPMPLHAIMSDVLLLALLLALLVVKTRQYKIVRRHPRARKEA